MAAARSRIPDIQGHVEPGFESVRYAFERNFEDHRELGAAFAVVHRGELVVDLWGGHRDRRRTAPWEGDTLTTIFSSTKGIAALTMAHAHSKGLFEWDAPVAEYWPEFAAGNKGAITLRQVFAHQAGLSAIDRPFDLRTLGDHDRFAKLLAAQRPAWEPGSRHGYHATSLGWYQSEILRRVDPERRSLGRYLREELAAPLGLDIHIGLPKTFPESRIARIQRLRKRSLPRVIGRRDAIPAALALAMLNPRSLTRRSFPLPKMQGAEGLNADPAVRAVEIPSANGVADARSIARLYGLFATGGTEVGLRKQTLEDLMAEPRPPSGGSRDLILRTDCRYSLGFLRPHPRLDWASSMRAFGTPGAGGSFGFADPDARLGMGYVMNRMGGYLFNDPREKALRDATYRAIAKLGPGR